MKHFHQRLTKGENNSQVLLLCMKMLRHTQDSHYEYQSHTVCSKFFYTQTWVHARCTSWPCTARRISHPEEKSGSHISTPTKAEQPSVPTGALEYPHPDGKKSTPHSLGPHSAAYRPHSNDTKQAWEQGTPKLCPFQAGSALTFSEHSRTWQCELSCDFTYKGLKLLTPAELLMLPTAA